MSESKNSKSRRKQLSLFIDLKKTVMFHMFNKLRAFGFMYRKHRASLVAQLVKNLPAMQET